MLGLLEVIIDRLSRKMTHDTERGYRLLEITPLTKRRRCRGMLIGRTSPSLAAGEVEVRKGACV
jgi:hypothetical protein